MDEGPATIDAEAPRKDDRQLRAGPSRKGRRHTDDDVLEAIHAVLTAGTFHGGLSTIVR